MKKETALTQHIELLEREKQKFTAEIDQLNKNIEAIDHVIDSLKKDLERGEKG